MLNAVKTLQSRLNLAKLYNLRRISLCASYRILTLSQNYLKNDEQIMKCLTNPYTVVNKVYLSSKANGNSPTNGNEFNELKFENFCSETLEALSDYFDELVEKCSDLSEADVTNNDGVLTISLGKSLGTYVINKQTPNKQIWLSSPRSGPKRFDFLFTSNASATTDARNIGYWYYKHEKLTLHELLDKEFSDITGRPTDFQKLPFGLKC